MRADVLSSVSRLGLSLCLLGALWASACASEGAGNDGDTEGNGSGDGDGDGDAPVEIEGCDGATLFERPQDLAARGPWQVGARSLTVAGRTTEVWYPAEPGSAEGKSPKGYDTRTKLPPEEAEKITDEVNALQMCGCYDALPLDAERGPYPVVVYVHGTAAWNTVSLTQMEHWASRGFVVVAMDHPGLFLWDTLAAVCPFDPTGPRDLSGDTDALLAALANGDDGLDFLDGRIDLDRVAAVGHSAGGGAVAGYVGKPGMEVIIPMASGSPVSPDAKLKTTMFMGGDADGVVAYSATQGAYDDSTGDRYLVGLANAGHLVFSDICELKNDQGKNILEVAEEAGVCATSFAGALFDCDPSYIDPVVAKEIVNFATSAVLEGHLMCSEALGELDSLEQTYPQVAEYRREAG